jgi:hypothetical protein
VPDILACGPVATTYTLSITPQVYAFRPGRVNVIVSAFICAPNFAICSANGSDFVDQTFRVKRTR